jgi:hypothetical protein
LIFIDLDNNPITKFSKDSFKDFDQLKYLNLWGIPKVNTDKTEESFLNLLKLFQETNQEAKQFIKIISRFNFDLENSFENADRLLKNTLSFPI